MSHTSEAFKKGKAMIAFLTAGVPSMEDTVKYVLDLEKAGVDLRLAYRSPIPSLMGRSSWKRM